MFSGNFEKIQDYDGVRQLQVQLARLPEDVLFLGGSKYLS